MILVCPNCIARYRVKVEALGATGRRVKCSKCGHVWHAEPPEHVVEVVRAEPEADAPSGVRGAGRAPPRAQLPVPARPARRSRRQSLWTWIFCIAILAICVAGYEARYPVVREWPWLAPVYEGFGIVVEERRGTQPGRSE